MVEKKSALDTIRVVLFYIGQCATLFGAFDAFVKLPAGLQPILAIVSASAWFLSAWLIARIPNKPETRGIFHIISRSAGIAQLGLALLLWMIIKPETEIARSAMYLNILLAVSGFTNAYTALIFFFFPKVLQAISRPSPDPLAALPRRTREIVAEGEKRINDPIRIFLLGGVLTGSVGYLLWIFIFREAYISVFFVPAVLGFVIGLALGIVRAYEWQEWARQSGIPEEELKAAAKLAHLWWPKKHAE